MQRINTQPTAVSSNQRPTLTMSITSVLYTSKDRYALIEPLRGDPQQRNKKI